MSNLIDKLPGPVASFARWVRDGRSTSKISRLIAYTFVLAAACVVVIEGSNYAEYKVIKTVTEDSAKSVEMFHNLGGLFARMGEDFLVETSGKGQAVDQTKDFQTANDLIRQLRFKATQNTTYCPGLEHWNPKMYPKEAEGECGVILRIEQHRDELMADVTRTRLLQEQHNAGAAMTEAHKAYQVVIGKLLQDTKAGAAVNLAYLENGYAQRHSVYKEVFWTDIGVGAFFLAIMVLVWYRVVYGRFHRMVNVYLALALGVGGFGFWNAITSFGNANAHLESFKENSFDSILPLSDLQAAVYEARAMQALALIDGANGAGDTKALDAAMARVGKLGTNASFEDAIAATSKGYQHLGGCVAGQTAANAKAVKKLQSIQDWPVTEGIMTGGLAHELNNLTWCGEYEAATNTVRAYAQFVALWPQVQQLIAQNQRDQAMKLFAGSGQGEGAYLLKRLVDEDGSAGNLGAALKLNKQAADMDEKAAFASISHVTWGAPILALIMWGFVIIGVVRQRAAADPARVTRKHPTYTS